MAEHIKPDSTNTPDPTASSTPSKLDAFLTLFNELNNPERVIVGGAIIAGMHSQDIEDTPPPSIINCMKAYDALPGIEQNVVFRAILASNPGDPLMLMNMQLNTVRMNEVLNFYNENAPVSDFEKAFQTLSPVERAIVNLLIAFAPSDAKIMISEKEDP